MVHRLIVKMLKLSKHQVFWRSRTKNTNMLDQYYSNIFKVLSCDIWPLLYLNGWNDDTLMYLWFESISVTLIASSDKKRYAQYYSYHICACSLHSYSQFYIQLVWLNGYLNISRIIKCMSTSTRVCAVGTFTNSQLKK